MASQRRPASLSISLPPQTSAASRSVSRPLLSASSASPDRPPLSALFLIEFDVRAGYTIAWKAALSPELLAEGRVEYKSLPSGLHTVARDLVYFVHDGGHAGLAAFCNEPCCDEGARNARMVAVGVLVPLGCGRLGRVWRHAASLEQMALCLAKNGSQTALLEHYWQEHKAVETSHGPPSAGLWPSTAHGRRASDATLWPAHEHSLSPQHPAWSLTRLLDVFGPLVFPIHRAAVLRKRILISCHAPLHQVCDFVYDFSILSSLPLSVAHQLPASSHTARLRPLFAVGVHDIAFLSKLSQRHDAPGWIACTTDSILAVKDTLWDVLITMPPAQSSDPKAAWPVVESSSRVPIKATQRDLRRFFSLRSGLARIAAAPAVPPAPLQDEAAEEPRFDQIVEPQTWASLAYSGYMWWASAGEQFCAEEHDEAVQDAALLADLAEPVPSPTSSSRRPASAQASIPDPSSLSSPTQRRASDAEPARVELALVTYFHRLTSQMLSVMSNLINAYPDPYHDDDDQDQAADDDDDDDDDDDAQLLPSSQDVPILKLDGTFLEAMGLDIWSSADAAFVRDLAAVYFGRRARVDVKGLEICGVRVC
ncbi:hypothetical protein CDD81_5708 [Ophiocordyceps australis]|uniref:DUF4484 domain-containing protein n=1 Tax=Ophiocordyceps australis TaxID=1399860 RepID=A0A2C5Y7D6_9HYPO|nr:hypothetical protein CDD81_5708 [Ophiocordyceps australis]